MSDHGGEADFAASRRARVEVLLLSQRVGGRGTLPREERLPVRSSEGHKEAGINFGAA